VLPAAGQDVDFERLQIVVRQGKGDKDRIVMLPLGVRERLAEQVRHRQVLHERDLARGRGAGRSAGRSGD